MRLAELILAPAIVSAGWAQTITIVQPQAAGVELIGSQSAEFQTYVQGAISPEVLAQFSCVAALRGRAAEQFVAGCGGLPYQLGDRASREGRMGIWGSFGDRYLNPGASVVVDDGI